MHSIYMIENKVNSKKYIGKTNNPVSRAAGHFTKSHNSHLRYAMAKYGKENFEFTILEEGLTDETVDQAEIQHIANHNSFVNGYNQTPGGEGGNTLLDPETAMKHSIATSAGKKGIKRKPFTAEHKAKLAKILQENSSPKKRARPVLVEYQRFSSQTEAAKLTGIKQGMINGRLQAGRPGYKYLDIMEN